MLNIQVKQILYPADHNLIVVGHCLKKASVIQQKVCVCVCVRACEYVCVCDYGRVCFEGVNGSQWLRVGKKENLTKRKEKI